MASSCTCSHFENPVKPVHSICLITRCIEDIQRFTIQISIAGAMMTLRKTKMTCYEITRRRKLTIVNCQVRVGKRLNGSKQWQK